MSVLSSAKRRRMKPTSFALPRRKGDPKSVKGHYPIPDARHGRNAIARVHQHGTPSEIRKVEARVHRKFPSIKISGYARRHKRH